ncbi:MAG: TatD family hydrolase [Sphaerochaetaceae bacterium]|jgi:TatD DNase family protein
MKLFDTHAHIGLIHEDQMEQLLIIQLAKRKSVVHIVSICNSLHDFEEVYENLKTASGVYHAVGVSPSEVKNPGLNWENRLQNFAKLDRVVAIGEIGLDYYRNFGDKNSQVELFIRQLDIARSLDYPVIIHNREAGRDILDILKSRLGEKGGVFHCYSENWEFAKEALDLPMYFSFAGNITYKNVRDLHDTIVNLPLDRILIESESPFMVPSAYKGKRNKPAYLVETAKAVAELKNLSLEETAEALFENSLRAFYLTENE